MRQLPPRAGNLATSHGLPLAQVMRVRLQFRREAWTCRVAYVPCTVCGGRMTIGWATAGSNPHHGQCRPAQGEAIRAIQSDRQRYLSGVPRRPSKVGGRTAWAEEEDAVLIARMPNESVRSIARSLGRTEASVRSRRTKLRLDGRIDQFRRSRPHIKQLTYRCFPLPTWWARCDKHAVARRVHLLPESSHERCGPLSSHKDTSMQPDIGQRLVSTGGHATLHRAIGCVRNTHAEPLVCVSCGKPIMSSDLVCPHCGISLVSG